MATRDEPFAQGTPCWVELSSSDLDKSKAFYAGLFGWSALDAGESFGNYVQFLSDGRPVAGMMGNADATHPDVWATYISTNDINGTIEAGVSAGGKVAVNAMQVADLGSMALMSDPAGAFFGLWQPGSFFGFSRYNEAGSVTWDELHSKEFAASTAFYEKVFGWQMEKTSDTDDFRYFQGQIDGETVAGLMDSKSFLPPEVPSHWAVYFSVDDADAVVARASELGGSTVRPAEDTPFGRVADIADSTGAPFKIHSVNLAWQS